MLQLMFLELSELDIKEFGKRLKEARIKRAIQEKEQK